jgi:hypothetical protein
MSPLVNTAFEALLLKSAHEGASFKPPGGIIYFWAARFRAVFLRMYARAQIKHAMQ